MYCRIRQGGRHDANAMAWCGRGNWIVRGLRFRSQSRAKLNACEGSRVRKGVLGHELRSLFWRVERIDGVHRIDRILLERRGNIRRIDRRCALRSGFGRLSVRQDLLGNVTP